MMKWREMLNADCPKRDGRLNDRCDVVCPDLPKVFVARADDEAAKREAEEDWSR